MELISAARLKAHIRSTEGAFAYFPDEGTAHQTPQGWVLKCGPYVLRSARIREPRYFKTVDALINIARECGLAQVEVITDSTNNTSRTVDLNQLDAFDESTHS